MKPILRRLSAVSTGVLVALSMSVSAAGASNPGDQHRPARFPHGPVQVADQVARTDQDARSFAKSEQIIPINANVPVQILGLGKNGGDTKQSNRSSASSATENSAGTEQSVDQHQSRPAGRYHVPKPGGWKDHGPKGHGPKDHDGWKGHGPKDRCPTHPDGSKDHDRKGHGPKGHDDWKDHGKKDHGPKAHGPDGAFQGASQWARTDQDAESEATSKQFAPINVNAPIQILSLGTNGGDTKQSNSPSASSAAVNRAGTEQSVDQDQSAPSKGGWDHGGGAFQGASQGASTDQVAGSDAESEQVLPVNLNVPVQALSLGHNGGDTAQSNSSSAESFAGNQAGTTQVVGQVQDLLGGLG